MANWTDYAQPAEYKKQTLPSDMIPENMPTAGTSSPSWMQQAQMVEYMPQEQTKSSSADNQAQRSVNSSMDVPVGGNLSAAVQGYNSAVPFGERIAAGIGALGAYGYDKLTGLDQGSLSDYYNTARESQKQTAEQNPISYAAGQIAGIGTTIPAAFSKVIGGGQAATSGIRGALNQIPEASNLLGKFVQGGELAKDAGTLAKISAATGKAVRSAAVAAPMGAVYSYGASESPLLSEQAFRIAGSGALTNAAVGGGLSLAGSSLKSAILPKIDKATENLVKRAQDFGINLSLDQIGNGRVRNSIQKISQNLPFAGVDNFQGEQRSQWMRAVAGTIGENADNLSPEVINNYLQRASNDFSQAISGRLIDIPSSTIQAVADLTTKANKNIADNSAKVVRNNVDDFMRNIGATSNGQNVVINGEKLASLRSQIIRELPTMDHAARPIVSDIIDHIDDAVSSQLPQDVVETLKTARNQWKNYKTLEPLLERSPDGTINPTQLLNRVASSKYIKSSRSEIGQNDLVDLAKIGKKFLPIKEGSDTAIKMAAIQGLGGGAALTTAPLTTASTLAANTAYQKFINQNPAMVRAALGQQTTSSLPILDMLTAAGLQ